MRRSHDRKLMAKAAKADRDRGQLLRDLVLTAAIIGFAIYTTVILHEAQGASDRATAAVAAVRHETRARARQRIADERASCRKVSRSSAALVNLDWTYWQSEIQLARNRSTAAFERALAALSPNERTFLALLIRSGNPSRFILRVRADADFKAAFVQAQAVDYRDLRFVAASTPLGSEAPARAWVTRAHYGCDAAFR